MPTSAAKAADALRSCDIAAIVSDDLIHLTAVVIRSWIETSKEVPQLRAFLRRRRFLQEIEETLVAINEILKYFEKDVGVTSGTGHSDGEVAQYDNSSDALATSAASSPAPRHTVYDLCSGKGFLSFLLAYLTPLLPPLSDNIREVVMVDKNSEKHNSIELSHIDASSNDRTTHVPIRVVQANLHDKQLPVKLGLRANTRAVLVGIHLCERLSSRCVHLYNALSEVEFLVLSPCCVPMKGDIIRLKDKSVDPARLCASSDPYTDWVNFLVLAVESSSPRSDGTVAAHFDAPLQGGPQRKNKFIVASREWRASVGQLDVGAVDGRQHAVPTAPNTELECSEFWYKGRCNWGQSCKYQHVRGSYLHGAHV